MLHNTRHRLLPRKPHLKPQRPGKRKRMTLIAAFRCEIENEQGVIICADSQESWGDYRVTVDKIKPRDANLYDLCFGGAGEIGALIDAFGNAIEREVNRWNLSYSEEEARVLLENEIVLFNSRQVDAYPALPDEKVIDFIVCLRDKATHAIYLWKVSGSTIEPIRDHDLIGWDQPLYKYEAKRLYRNVANVRTAMTVGLHLLSFGKGTATSIDKPFHVIGVSPSKGMWPEPQHALDQLEAKVSGVNEALSKLIMLAPDVSATEERLKNALQLFKQEILGLRHEVRQYTLQISDSLHHLSDHVPLSVGSVEPENPPQNPKPKKDKKTSKRKKP